MVGHGHAILSSIPGVESLSSGVAVQPDARYQYYVRMRFRALDAVADYDEDPGHHQLVDDDFAPLLADRMVLSYALRF
jgi:hypothetical protein